MFKKTLAGIMSAVLCTSALLTPDLDLVGRNAAQTPSASPAYGQSEAETGLTGSNSLAKFLAQKSQKPTAGALPNAMPLKASAAEESYFAITNLEFDSETGLLQANTSQTQACKLVVNFVDEDNPENIYKLEADVQPGDYVITSASADLSRLPEFYSISAMLTDEFGLPVSSPFSLTTYTRKMQEILAAEVSDFEPAQIINLDTDETTNFIVLSEDTVKAETAEGVNTLVSADYDQNIYVFDNIDDSIRSLTAGQYFYIQPTEEDMIAISVRNITVDGSTATVTGSSEIDDMFDFIKMEATVDNQTEYNTGAADASAADYVEAAAEQVSDRSYRGVGIQSIGSQEELDVAWDRTVAHDVNAEMTEIPLKRTLKQTFSSAEGYFSFTPSVNLDSKVKWNFYKSFDFTSVFLIYEAKLSVNFQCKGSTAPIPQGDPANPTPHQLNTSPSDMFVAETAGHHLFEVPFHNSGALKISAYLDLRMDISGEFDLTFEKTFTRGIMYDSEVSFEEIKFDTKPKFPKMEYKGSVALTLKLGIEVSALAGLIVGNVGAGLRATATVSTNDLSICPKNSANIFLPQDAVTTDSIHCCDVCQKVHLGITVIAEGKLSIGWDLKDKLKIFQLLPDDINVGRLKYEKSFSLEFDTLPGGIKLPSYDLYCSYNAGGDYNGFHFYKVDTTQGNESQCPHQAYKVPFHTHFLNVPEGYTLDAELRVGGQVYPLNGTANDVVTLYAVPRKNRNANYSYSIYVNGTQRAYGTFNIDNAPHDPIDNTIAWDDNEQIAVNTQPSDGTLPAVTTTTTTAEPDPVFDYSAYIPPKRMLTGTNDYFKLGDNIMGVYSNDGSFTIIGYGDMYDNPNIPNRVRENVCGVIMLDQNEAESLYINNIGSSLFSNMTNLEVVYMSKHITSIGNYAFNGCSNLKFLRYDGEDDTTKTFVLPENLTSIGNNAFYYCSLAAFGALEIPETVTFIGSEAFRGCSGITSVSFPSTDAATVSSYAFANCANITTASLGENVRCGGSYCYIFSSDNAMETLTIPAFNMGPAHSNWRLYMFFGSTTSTVPATLKTVHVTGGTEIPTHYFSNLSQLETITYPDNITEIGSYAFYNCSGLTAAALPQTLTAIKTNAFYFCTNAEFGDLVIPVNVTEIGSEAFRGCAKVTSVTVPGTDDPEATTTVGSYAFANCPLVTTAYLGENVRCGGSYCYIFSSDNAIETLTIPAFNMGPAHSNWRLYMFFGSTTSTVPATLKTVHVTGGTEIPTHYFSNLSQLETITYPDNITEIGSYAFYNCSGLTAAALPQTLTAIKTNAFYFCTNAEFGDLIIPVNVTEIGAEAFRGCAKTTSVTVPGIYATTIGSYAFANCPLVTTAYLGKNVRCCGGFCYIFSSDNAMETLTIPAFNMGPAHSNWRLCMLFGSTTSTVPSTLKTVHVTGGTEIPTHYFSNLSQLETITYPDNITEIGSYAFYNCSGLTAAALPQTLTAIKTNAFYFCTNAEFGDLIIPVNVTEIGAEAFRGCAKVTSVTVPGTDDPEAPTAVGSYVFANCTLMTEAYLGENVTCAGSYCYIFSSCSAMEKLTIPAFNMGSAHSNWRLYMLFGSTASNVPTSLSEVIVTGGTEIPNHYFSSLTHLSSVTLPAELETVNSYAFNNCTGLTAAYLIGEDSDWDNVTISETGNAPLLALVRSGRPLVICAGPYDVTVEEGDLANFFVYAAGKYDLAFQWQYSEDDGATWVDTDVRTAAIAFAAEAELNGRLFRCIVTDDQENSEISSEALLTVTERTTLFLLGDVDLNGVVEQADAILLTHYLTEDPTAVISDAGLINADVNMDGISDMMDIALIIQMAD